MPIDHNNLTYYTLQFLKLKISARFRTIKYKIEQHFKEQGSGIGLSLAHQIMRLHGGSISVQSNPGIETIFTLKF